MNRLKLIYLSFIVLFTLTACTPVGGNCNYQKTVGEVLVKSIDKNRCIVDFNAIQNIEAQCFGDVVIGKKYFAVYEKAMHGSCTPYFLKVYGEEIKRKE